VIGSTNEAILGASVPISWVTSAGSSWRLALVLGMEGMTMTPSDHSTPSDSDSSSSEPRLVGTVPPAWIPLAILRTPEGPQRDAWEAAARQVGPQWEPVWIIPAAPSVFDSQPSLAEELVILALRRVRSPDEPALTVAAAAGLASRLAATVGELHRWTPTLPMRFTQLSDPAPLGVLLARFASHWKRRLHAVAGRDEYGIRWTHSANAARTADHSSPVQNQAVIGPGTAHLLRLRARHAPPSEVERFRSELGDLVVSWRYQPGSNQSQGAVALLIDRLRVPEFLTRFSTWAEQARRPIAGCQGRWLLSGPFAPYSFVGEPEEEVGAP
jgi:hypothetical protein